MALTKVTGSVIKDSVSLSGNVSVGGTLTYQDVTNVDALGIGTFRSGINVSGGQLDVGSNIKLGNAGVITATSFVGSGANLTGITQTTINNNADNRVITGSGSANTLEGEATLTFDTTNGLVCDSGTVRCNNGFSSDVDLILNADANNNGTGSIILKESGSEKVRITSDGKMGLGTSSVDELLHVANTGGGASILIETNASSGGNILFGDNSSNTVGRIQYVHSDNSMRFNTDGAEKLRIDSSGRLLVGSAAVTYNQSPLYVSGTDPVVATFHHSDGGTNDEARIALGALVNNPPFNRGVYLTAKNNGNGHDFIVATSASHAAGPSEKLRIPSAGGIELKTDGKGIQFPTPQTPSNSDGNRVGISSEMRYYETGTFVPGLSSTVLNSLQNPVFTDASYARRIGRYVRCGHLVFCNIEIKMASTVTYYQAGISDATAPVCITNVTPFYYAYANRFASSGQPDFNPCNVFYSSSGLTNDTVYACLRREFPGPSYIQITKPGTNGTNQFNSTNYGEVFPANATIAVSYTYAIDTDNIDN